VLVDQSVNRLAALEAELVQIGGEALPGPMVGAVADFMSDAGGVCGSASHRLQATNEDGWL
jgi:hypothetical protein